MLSEKKFLNETKNHNIESGIDNTSSNISTIPIAILTTILYTSKLYIFLNHNTGTILEQICIPVLCTILVYQYCDRQVQEILNLLESHSNSFFKRRVH